MKSKPLIVTTGAVLLWLLAPVVGQESSFPVVSVIDASTIAGRPVQLDDMGKLLPWPMPGNTGYSYSVLCADPMDDSLGPIQPAAAAVVLLLFRL